MAEDNKIDLDKAGAAAFEVLTKMTEGKPEGTVAKLLVLALASATANPWLLGAEPLLQRLLERLNNKAGKDAVAEIAKEVEKDEDIRRIASEVPDLLQPFFALLYRAQQSRGALGVDAVPYLDGSIADAQASIGIMLHRMEERLASGGISAERPLYDRLILTGPTQSMRATARGDGREFEVRAARYGSTPRLMLELTNMSRTDVRVLQVLVDVIECIEIDIEDVWSWYGMMKPVRKYSVQLKAEAGRYPCIAAENAQDEYLVMSSGELEVFAITLIPPPTEVLYRLRATVELSSGERTFVQEFSRVVQFGTYDASARVVSNDHPRHGDGPPPDDGGDTCVQDTHALAGSMSARAARARS